MTSTFHKYLILLPLLISLFIPSRATAQRWESTICDLGVMEENGGLRGGSFLMVNDSDAPLTILKVKTSCGCTAASYEEAPIAVGDTARVSFAYDPARRPGRFEKTLRVYFQKGEELARVDTLKIRGNVNPDPQTLISQYPVAVGPLRLGSKLVDMGKVKRGVARHSFIQIFNTSQDSIVCALWTYNDALSATQVPEILAPGQAGIISIQLDASREPRSGELLYELLMQSGATTHAFPVRAEIEETAVPESTIVGHQNKKKRFSKTYTQTSTPSAEEDSSDGETSKQKKKKLFSKTYTEVKKIEKEKKKKKLFSNSYTEVKQDKK